MIVNLLSASELLRPYEPQVPTDQLVEALNRWYHGCEVATYDHSHAEIRRQLPPLWREMVGVARQRLANRSWRILDFGCGTGFEASQLLTHIDRDTIGEFCCYDLSPEMLDHCRARIAPLFPGARFTSSFDEIPMDDGCFNLVATNSVLHHLPSPLQTMGALESCLSADAVWLAGHEPSSRFYKNPECCQSYGRFLRRYRRQRWLSPAAYLGFAWRQTGLSQTPSQVAAAAAVEAGMLKRRPPSRVVSRLVDLHVAHSAEEAQLGRGFDFREMEDELAGRWQRCWTATYSFMGPFYEQDLPTSWRAETRRLAMRHATDGANFCAVWQCARRSGTAAKQTK